MEPTPEDIHRLQLENKMKSGANWFIWIGVLSLINSIVIHCGGEFGFIFGLGITMVIDVLLKELSILIAVLIDLFITSLFVLIGILGGKGISALLIVGMILYTLDTLIFVLAGEWLPIAVHVFALIGIFNGIKAGFELKRLKLPPAA